ncbi:MAG: hypothetical protein Q8M22_05055 [Actinomycetota bacterium]|nr:hypothetical protein [Actinomycetota bacterium]
MTTAEPGSIVGVVGCGVTGARVVGLLLERGVRVAVFDPRSNVGIRRRGVVVVDSAADLAVCDLVVMCQPAPHAELAAQMLANGTRVVSIGDDLADLREMLSLHEVAVRHHASLVVGAGMAPGLSGLLARSLAAQLHTLDELHVAIHGTAGPACARQHHDALGDTALGWHDHEWIEPPGGSGRDLVWFPEPIGAHDCYRAALGDPLLLQRSFPQVGRISARVSATRRDRFTARLPMLTPPHASGSLGAVRVEARGADALGERVTVISGASGHIGDLAAAVSAMTAYHVLVAGLAPGVHALGDESLPLLHDATTFGVRVQEFTGVARATSW